MPIGGMSESAFSELENKENGIRCFLDFRESGKDFRSHSDVF